MSNQISGLIANARIISGEVEENFGELTAEQLNWKPDAETWSVGQCFEHLITTNNLYFEKIEKVADGTHVNNWYSAIPLVPALIGKILKKAVSPDSQRKIKTFPIFEPAYSDISETIVRDFQKNQDKLISFMDKTKDFDIKKIKIPEPISVALNVTLADAFEILVIHERRHFDQAQRVLGLEEFPA